MPDKALSYTLLFVAACFCSLLAHGQLKAYFTVDKDGGCAPLVVPKFLKKTLATLREA